MGDLTKNISWAEMACKDGTPVPDQLKENARKIANRVQTLADVLGAEKIILTSAFRTPLHNNFVGGVPTSTHLEAKAIDFYLIKGGTVMNPQLVGHYIAKGDYDGGLGIYNNFTHLDIGSKRMWNKSDAISDDNLSEYESGVIRKGYFTLWDWMVYHFNAIFKRIKMEFQ